MQPHTWEEQGSGAQETSERVCEVLDLGFARTKLRGMEFRKVLS